MSLYERVRAGILLYASSRRHSLVPYVYSLVPYVSLYSADFQVQESHHSITDAISVADGRELKAETMMCDRMCSV